MGAGCYCSPFINKNYEFEIKKYFYQVGIRNLHITNYIGNLGDDCADCLAFTSKRGLTHHCLKLGDEIFELISDGYHRRKTTECPDYYEYIWSQKIKGNTDITPDELDKYIIEKGNLIYHSIKNNCQDFVKFCLRKINNDLVIHYHSETCLGPCIPLL